MNRAKAWALAGGLLAAGCAGPRPPPMPAAGPAPDSAAEQARREERLKLMQRYWLDRTEGTVAGEAAPLPAAPGRLSYPAGRYDGLLFSAREAAGPGLEEPVR